MGARANYLVVRDGAWRLFYSHWGANGIECDLLAGPDAADRFITAQREVTGDPGGWLDDVWCEGAALVDHDRRLLLWFGVHLDDYAYRSATLAVLGRTWPGWRVEWAYDGLADLAAHVGMDRSAVRVDPDPDDPAPVDPDDGVVECLVTVADGGTRRAYAVWNTDAAEIIDHGERVLGMLPDAARVTACPATPMSGVHLDTSARTAAVWTITLLNGALARTEAGWPGWTWEFWADRYEHHRAAAGGGVTLPEPDLRAALAALRDRWSGHREHDPLPGAQRFLDHMTEVAETVTPSPYLFDHRTVPARPAERDTVAAAIRATAVGHGIHTLEEGALRADNRRP